MKTTVSRNRFVLLGLCVALFAAVTVAGARGDEAAPKEAEWREIFADDKGYLDEYKKVQAPEETFSGTITYEEQKGASTLMRWAPYKLDGVGVYTGSKDLKEYVGKKVEIIGKKNSFELEGQVVTEIWPVKIRLAAAQEEPPKTVEQKEIPAKAVNGLLFEIKLLNTQPLLPSDTSFEIEYRFTNVQEKGDIQLIDIGGFGSEFLYASIIGPDGKEIGGPQYKVKLALPASPTCTLAAGCFYGKMQKVLISNGLKPGKYSLSFMSKNIYDLKDKGFNCWTGEIESNTIVFEVAGGDVKPVNGILMFIRMTKEKYAVNEPVTYELRIYNASEEDQEVYPPEILVHLCTGTVTNENGKVMDWPVIPFELEKNAMRKVAPGAALTAELDLRAQCKLPPGKYIFRLTGSNPALTSNEVKFEIVKAEDGN